MSIAVAILTARPLIGGFDQGFQYIQEYTGFFTPGIVVIFVLGLFWKRANEAGALAAALGSFALSLALKYAWPELPFVNRVGVVFLLCTALAVIVSLATASGAGRDRIQRLAGEARDRGEDTFAYGMLYQRELDRGEQALAGYDDAVREVRKAFKKIKP